MSVCLPEAIRLGFRDSPRLAFGPAVVIVIGAPVAKKDVPENCHPPAIPCCHPRADSRILFPLPTGTCHDNEAVTTCPRSQSERPRSSRRLFGSCAAPGSPPFDVMLSCDDSSMDLL